MSTAQFGIRNLLHRHPVIPVVNITDVADVRPLLARLVAQGISCIELTLRSDVALEAIAEAMAYRPAGFSVGVGTIVTLEQVGTCRRLGVDFLVSPGLSDPLAAALDLSEIPFLPGVMTPSEIISAMSRGWDTFKLFPSNIAGGIKALKSYGAVFPAVRFCPTGGIDAENYQEILDLPNVISVGGSWVAKG